MGFACAAAVSVVQHTKNERLVGFGELLTCFYKLKKTHTFSSISKQQNKMIKIIWDFCSIIMGLLKISQFKFLFKTGLTPKLDHVAQSFVWVIFEYLQGQRFDKLSEKSVPVLKYPQEEAFFCYF